MEGNVPQQHMVSPPAVQQPPHMYPPVKKGYVTLAIMGIIILLIGGMVTVSVGFLEQPDSDDYDDGQSYQDAMDGYSDLRRIIPTLGSVIQYVGVILFAIGMLTGGLTDNELSPNVRLGILIALGIIVGFTARNILVLNY